MPFTYNGFGTKYYGEADHHPDGSFITTEWITAAYIPLIPLRSYRLVHSGNPFEDSFACVTFAVLDELPLIWSQVLRVYSFLLCSGAWYAISIWFFFSKFALDDLFVSHRTAAVLLLIAFIATLATPLLILWLVRRRSMLKVGVKPRELGDNIVAGKKSGTAVKVFAVVVAMIVILPPMIVTELNLPPASWLNMRRPNSSVVYYYPEFTFIILVFANLAVLGALLLLLSSITKMLTGKKLGELFRRGSGKEASAASPEKPAPLPITAAPQSPPAAPPTKREQVLITHCQMCECPIEPEQQSTLKTCPGCGADLSRQRRYTRA